MRDYPAECRMVYSGLKMCFRLVADNLWWVCTMLVWLPSVPFPYLSILCIHMDVRCVSSLGWFIRVPFFAWAVKVGRRKFKKSRQSKAIPRSCVSTGHLEGVMKQQDKSALMKG